MANKVKGITPRFDESVFENNLKNINNYEKYYHSDLELNQYYEENI
jgi:hypothetical protein